MKGEEKMSEASDSQESEDSDQNFLKNAKSEEEILYEFCSSNCLHSTLGKNQQHLEACKDWGKVGNRQKNSNLILEAPLAPISKNGTGKELDRKIKLYSPNDYAVKTSKNVEMVFCFEDCSDLL